LNLIQEQGLQPLVIEYLKTPPNAAEIKELVTLLKLRPRDIVRTKDEGFAALHLNLDDDEAVIAALVQHPELLERPIVVQGSQAVVARPPERVRELF
jgi:arsenate reductase